MDAFTDGNLIARMLTAFSAFSVVLLAALVLITRSAGA